MKDRKSSRPQRTKRKQVDDSEDLNAAAIDQVEQQQLLKARPTPVRYDPKAIDFASLKDTWPSLPMDVDSRSATIIEKLSSLSGRLPNGYVPPYELGRRLWKGQNVLFENEMEKSEALEEVKRLAQVHADKISQQKGEIIEPREIKFSTVTAPDAKALLEAFAQGKYPTLKVSKDQPAVLGDVVKNLRNNGTYQTAGKRPQFLAKFESLLTSSRVKRT